MIPKNEMVITTYADVDGNDVCVGTQKIGSETFFLYEIRDGKEKKLGKGNSPRELEIKFNVRQRMGM